MGIGPWRQIGVALRCEELWSLADNVLRGGCGSGIVGQVREVIIVEVPT